MNVLFILLILSSPCPDLSASYMACSLTNPPSCAAQPIPGCYEARTFETKDAMDAFLRTRSVGHGLIVDVKAGTTKQFVQTEVKRKREVEELDHYEWKVVEP